MSYGETYAEPAAVETGGGRKLDIQELMMMAYERGASDIHLTVGRPPVFRVDGDMQNVDAPVLEARDTEGYVRTITADVYLQRIAEVGGADFAYPFGDYCRFRVSAFKQKGMYQLCLRIIPSKLLTFEQLGLTHPRITELMYTPRGLVLVTGPTGSGKSTTLASMINYINVERDAHIITIEDPIEFYHPHRTSVVTQREIGVDTPSFAMAIRGALRQDPDVILVGEMRDLETIATAITAAETGHLVFATLHTNTAKGTVNRIIDAFPTDQQEMVRTQLAVSLVAVICQTLLPKARGTGRVAAFEIMFASDAVRANIKDNKIMNIDSAIQTGGKMGMQTLEQGLLTLYQRGLVTYEAALQKCARKDEFEKMASGG
ncbi:MAG: type IV pilus twitching motility protein PilT [Candidatus Hydrogenedentota bacterium]